MSNGQVWENRREIDCHSVNVIYYLKCNTCGEKETDIGKIIGDNTKGFKVFLEEPMLVSSLSIIIRLNKSDRLEIMEKHFHSKNHNTMNNVG